VQALRAARAQVLGKRLGREMALVAKGVAALTPAQIAQYEASGSIELCGVQLGVGDIKVQQI
jgi:hypothetical protein